MCQYSYHQARPSSKGVPSLLSDIGVIVEPLDYPQNTLDEKVQSLVREVKGKTKSLALTQITLTKYGVGLAEANKTLGYSCKTIKDLKESLRETQEGWKKKVYNLREMRLENISFSKKHLKVVDEGHYVTQVSLENTL